MGLDCTKAKDLLADIRRNTSILERNCVVLPDTHVLRKDFNCISPALCVAPGMVRFEYQGWDGVIRRVEGHVCSVECNDTIGLDVKIWTEKNEMLSVYFSCTFGINVVQLPSDYTAKEEDKHEF